MTSRMGRSAARRQEGGALHARLEELPISSCAVDGSFSIPRRSAAERPETNVLPTGSHVRSRVIGRGADGEAPSQARRVDAKRATAPAARRRIEVGLITSWFNSSSGRGRAYRRSIILRSTSAVADESELLTQKSGRDYACDGMAPFAVLRGSSRVGSVVVLH